VGDAENAGLENVGPNRRGGKDGTGKRRTKFPGLKTHDHRLFNAFDFAKGDESRCAASITASVVENLTKWQFLFSRTFTASS